MGGGVLWRRMLRRRTPSTTAATTTGVTAGATDHQEGQQLLPLSVPFSEQHEDQWPPLPPITSLGCTFSRHLPSPTLPLGRRLSRVSRHHLERRGTVYTDDWAGPLFLPEGAQRLGLFSEYLFT